MNAGAVSPKRQEFGGRAAPIRFFYLAIARGQRHRQPRPCPKTTVSASGGIARVPGIFRASAANIAAIFAA